MTTLASLKSQLDKIQETYGDKEKCGYAISPMWKEQGYKGQIFLTPDDALAWCYEDAHKRQFKHLKLWVWCAPRWDCGNLVIHNFGGFKAERSDLKMVIHEDVHNNMIWCYDDTGISGRWTNPDCLAYPNEKPQYELLDFIRAKDIEWHETTAHMTREEHEEQHDHPCASRDLEDYYSIVTGTRPPNSLPESNYTCDICKYYDLLSMRDLPEGTEAKDLRDDELIALVKTQGGEVLEK